MSNNLRFNFSNEPDSELPGMLGICLCDISKPHLCHIHDKNIYDDKSDDPSDIPMGFSIIFLRSCCYFNQDENSSEIVSCLAN